MKPAIEGTEFGSIVIGGKTLEHDIVVRLDGKVKKRKKRLSSELYGTSHRVSRAEAEHIYDKGAEQLIIGAGQQGLVALSEEAADYFARKKCSVRLLPTPEAADAWNKAEGAVIAMFHVTC
ncbi:MAG TPA: Mth938-like domain-containing protein [Anaerolineae bacterium]|nr:Mth938-like domain-containing protein [Anaerolineae bacterium]